MRRVEKYRADGKTELADAVKATIITTAAQREALVPMQIPERDGRIRMDADQLLRSLVGTSAANLRSKGDTYGEMSAEVFELLDTDEQRAEHSQRMAEFYQMVSDH